MVSHTANNQLWLDMEKELAELRAENERMENLLALDVHTCGPNCQRDGCVNRRLREENEALRRNLEASTVRLNESLYQQSRLQAEANERPSAADYGELNEQFQALRMDAERYRSIKKWDGAIRDGESAPNIRLYGIQGDQEEILLRIGTSIDDLDAAIDAAMKGQ